MAKHELSRAADRDLDDIYVYTCRQFGPLQADVYFESLEECLSKLAENPLLGMAPVIFGPAIVVRAPTPHPVLQIRPNASNLAAGYRSSTVIFFNSIELVIYP